MPEEDSKRLFKCVWMTAGVLNYRLCDRGFDCERCLVDLAMRHGNVSVADLPEEVDLPKASPRSRPPRERTRQARISPPRGFLHPSHIYLRVVEGGNDRFGLDGIARRLLGRETAIEIPRVRTSIRRGQRVFRFPGSGREIALPSPIAGILLARNERVLSDPTQLRSRRRRSSWLAEVRPNRLREDLAHLLYGKRLKDWWREEIGRLREKLLAVHALTTKTLPDGGQFDPRVLEELNGEHRIQLIEEFLLRKESGAGGRR